MCKGRRHDIFASGWFYIKEFKNYAYTFGIVVVDTRKFDPYLRRYFAALGQFQSGLGYFQTWILIGWNLNICVEYTFSLAF